MNILVTRPMKLSDPTEYTYQWGDHIVKMIKKAGHNVIDLKRNEVTYERVTHELQKHHPRLYIHIGHGCPNSLQGQNECVLTRRFGVDELMGMPNFKEIMKPLSYVSGCEGSCLSNPDVCNPLCMSDTNVNNLKGTIVYTVACYSAIQLGKCAVKYGADVYCGFDDLMLFPVDDMGSQDLFRDVHMVFIKELLNGKTIEEAKEITSNYEDTLISFHKKTKYIALPLLWNKMHRSIHGNTGARL
jgi:hypothetical protein